MHTQHIVELQHRHDHDQHRDELRREREHSIFWVMNDKIFEIFSRMKIPSIFLLDDEIGLELDDLLTHCVVVLFYPYRRRLQQQLPRMNSEHFHPKHQQTIGRSSSHKKKLQSRDKEYELKAENESVINSFARTSLELKTIRLHFCVMSMAFDWNITAWCFWNPFFPKPSALCFRCCDMSSIIIPTS